MRTEYKENVKIFKEEEKERKILFNFFTGKVLVSRTKVMPFSGMTKYFVITLNKNKLYLNLIFI